MHRAVFEACRSPDFVPHETVSGRAESPCGTTLVPLLPRLLVRARDEPGSGAQCKISRCIQRSCLTNRSRRSDRGTRTACSVTSMRPLSTEADLRSAGERPRRLISWLVLAGTAAIPSTALAYRTELDTSHTTRGLALLLGLALGTCVWALAELVSTASPREQRVGATLPGGGLPGGGLPNGGLRVAVARMAGARVLVAAAIVSVLAMAARSVQVAVAMSLGALIGAALAAPSLTESRSALVPHPNRADGTQPLLRSRPALAVGPLLLAFGVRRSPCRVGTAGSAGEHSFTVALALAPRCSTSPPGEPCDPIRSASGRVGPGGPLLFTARPADPASQLAPPRRQPETLRASFTARELAAPPRWRFEVAAGARGGSRWRSWPCC